MSSKTISTGLCSARRSKKSRQAAKRSCARGWSGPPGRSAGPAAARRSAGPPVVELVGQAGLELARAESRSSASSDAGSASAPSRPAPSRSPPRRRRDSGPGARAACSATPSMYLKNSQASRDLPMPAMPVTAPGGPAGPPCRRGRSLTSRSSRSRPTNGASRPSDFSGPAPAGHHAQRPLELDRLALALEAVLPGILVGDRRLGGPRVASPTSTVPGSASVWIREAVLTRSPATIPWPLPRG